MCLARRKTAVDGRGAPAQERGQARRDSGQPVHLRIVAVGWPGPFAALVLFARSPLGKVTAHPPPGSPLLLEAARLLLRGGSKNFFLYTQGSLKQKTKHPKQKN
ncbi:hypothetical protein D5272_17255 [bacterium D16-76]|nr:hypothetical protein [bacterium D16-76]